MKKTLLWFMFTTISFVLTFFYVKGSYESHNKTKNAAQQQVSSPTPTTIPIVVPKSRDRGKIAAYLAKYRSLMVGTEDTLLTISSQYGIDYRLILSIARKESSLGKRACGYNVFGITSCDNSFQSYEEAYEYLAKLLAYSTYYADWRKTGSVYDLVKIYCPESEGCNTNVYVIQVKQFMDEL